MAGTLFRSLFMNTLTLCRTNTPSLKSFHTAPVYYAARKGTRAKARAKKVKVEVTKVGFVPHNQRGREGKQNKLSKSRFVDDEYKQISQDDVFPMKYYRWVTYSAEEAVKLHQETHHPTMYNVPDALVFAEIHLNMAAVKKNRYLDNFARLTLLPHFFPRDEERSILAFCKGQDLIREAIDAGATTAGGTEVVKKIQEGEIKLSDYDYIIAHPSVITDLVPIRGLLKRRFPTVRNGTLDPNLGDLVKKFAAGVQYKVMKDENQESLGTVSIPVGRLNMNAKQVAENIAALLVDLQAARPKREGYFITRCVLTSPPTTEKLKIDPFVYVERELAKEVQEDSDDEEEAVARG
ncbi:uncharacterized protein LOC113240453 [Hyposmocoma kahamanoa]|uniref:uncharacterized protein LOC113240453 n=1 Tax=Hyposmocoma kahamanoa TaxID=1477025 RepID=UPI000E6D9D5D|nr:uncharacterized protein LOC113240453 [Hyposmocoma kahamanoa]